MFTKAAVSRQISLKVPNIKFHENLSKLGAALLFADNKLEEASVLFSDLA
jgi:hypothetical protein